MYGFDKRLSLGDVKKNNFSFCIPTAYCIKSSHSTE